jgi:non-ribosomal peptide synthase protein (TIGR01720 family)
VKQIKEQLRARPGDGLGYGLLRYLNRETAPILAALPSAQISFNYLGRFGMESGNGHASWNWAPAAEDEQYVDPSGAVPAMHALDVMGIVRDLPDGPQLTLILTWPERLLAEVSARSLLDGWAAMLTGLATHVSRLGGGGHTPSDFSLIELSQRQIDELETKFSNGRVAR